MKILLKFLKAKDPSKLTLFQEYKLNKAALQLLAKLARQHINGFFEASLPDLLETEISYDNLELLNSVQDLIKVDLIRLVVMENFDYAKLEPIDLLKYQVILSPRFFAACGINQELKLAKATAYKHYFDYLQDQFERIKAYQKLYILKKQHKNHPKLYEEAVNLIKIWQQHISKRLQLTKIDLKLESFFAENELDDKEQIIFLNLLKENYDPHSDENFKEFQVLIEMISNSPQDCFENRDILRSGANLLDRKILGYEDINSAFNGVKRNFYITEKSFTQSLEHQKVLNKNKIKLEHLLKKQEIFELRQAKTNIDQVVLHPQTKETISVVLNQVDQNVNERLMQWGFKDSNSNIDAKMIFHGYPGTGKTLTALSIAKTLSKEILSIDCSKILSMYIGESEKNVKKIFDTFDNISKELDTKPILLLDEADQFLSKRSMGMLSSVDKMHNQMQNIFLEHLDKFQGILIATTNLLENIDLAFSRRFNYKIQFEKPNAKQRLELWSTLLPKQVPLASDIDLKTLAQYDLSGGQIEIVIKNTAYEVATKKTAVFQQDDFLKSIKKELKGHFNNELAVGFLS